MNIPRRYEGAVWEDVPPAIQAKVQEIGKTRKGLYIHGGVGSGKTHAVYAIFKKLKERNIMCRFHNTTELMFDIRRDFDRNPYDKMRWDERLPEYEGVLILDDLGAERPTDYVAEVLYLIVNTRYNQKLPTIFTSNLPVAELAERIGDRTASRIVEMCEIVKLDGVDRRLLQAKKQTT